MALLKCPECGASVSEFAEKCPKCGCPMYDIALENEVDARQWDHKKELRNTDTHMYDPEDLEKAAKKQGIKRRKPGQKKIVRNSGSSLPKRKKPKKAKSKKKKVNKIPLFVLIGILIIAGGIVYYFAASAPDRPDSEDVTLPTQQTQQDDYSQPTATPPAQDYDEPEETEPSAEAPTPPTQATQPPTQKPTPPPTTRPTQPPTEPEIEDPNQDVGGEDA